MPSLADVGKQFRAQTSQWRSDFSTCCSWIRRTHCATDAVHSHRARIERLQQRVSGAFMGLVKPIKITKNTYARHVVATKREHGRKAVE